MINDRLRWLILPLLTSCCVNVSLIYIFHLKRSFLTQPNISAVYERNFFHFYKYSIKNIYLNQFISGIFSISISLI